METTKKVMIGIEGKTGAVFDEEKPAIGMSLGLAANKRLGEHLLFETGIEGGYFQPAAADSKGKGPFGAFLGGGIFHQFDELAFIATLRARTGFDFSRWTPYGGAEIGTKLMFEMKGRDGLTCSYPFIGLDGGYIWDGGHGARAMFTVGFMFDLAR